MCEEADTPGSATVFHSRFCKIPATATAVKAVDVHLADEKNEKANEKHEIRTRSGF